MAYPTSKLEKALARRVDTASTRPTWQEWMGRHDTVPASAIMAPEVIQGFQGSWAAQYGLDQGVQTTDGPESPAQVQRQISHLGQPGMAEINFRPYDYGTTRQGKYGPSLVGHPVSFEIVGPTLKSPRLLHQWTLNTVGPSDILTLDTCTWRSTAALIDPLPAGINTLTEIYGLAAIPAEGLYLVVSLTGNAGWLGDAGGVGVPGAGGLGDGLIGHEPVEPLVRTPIGADPLGGQRSKYEIFRVIAITPTTLVLAPNKRIGDHFILPAPGTLPIIRAITLIKPVAARLVAVPGSGTVGREQVFAFVPPATALTPDILPPHADWIASEGDPWLGYAASSNAGVQADYPQHRALPVPQTIATGRGRLTGIFGEAPLVENTGRMMVVVDEGWAALVSGQVLCIRNATRLGAAQLSGTADGGAREGDPEADRLLGYWEVLRLPGPGQVVLGMVAQIDPLTGVPFYGSVEYLAQLQAGKVLGDVLRISWTVHAPVASLWLDSYLQPDKLDSARLQHIIDPSWVQPTSKGIDLTDVEASPARPDKAIFDTSGTISACADPGSLLDLGFRPVFFPAKVSGADLVPDYDHPITANQVVLDQTLPTEEQYLEVDYAAGLVRLSHPPKQGSELIPNAIFVGVAGNPRKEAVFFASFVPFSREPGQMSPAPRVTGGQSKLAGGQGCGDAYESADLYGSRLHWPLANQTITAGTSRVIWLTETLTPLDLPPSGFVEVVWGSDAPVGAPCWLDANYRRVSTWGYTAVIYADPLNGGHTTLEGCFGGGVAAAPRVINAANPATVVLRREVVAPNRLDGTTGTDFQADTTYGSSKRTPALRFKRADMAVGPDGSVVVDTRDALTEDHQNLFADLYSSWVIRGGALTTALPAGGAAVAFSELTVVIAGVRSVLPAQTVTLTLVTGNGYVYIDGTIPTCPVYACGTALPLPAGVVVPATPNHVLLGSYTDNGVAIQTYQDLRHPLTDVDKRLDITCGVPLGHDQPADAHFATLAEAVMYAARTMRPVAGEKGRYRRIKIIGPTDEPDSMLPIQPEVSGLIIEGASQPFDGADGDPQEVTWGTATSPQLFDLTACHNIVFRNVTFRFRSGLAPDALPRHRTLFTCDARDGAGNPLTNALFEGVTLNGPAHGFLYVNDDLHAPNGFTGVTLRNCRATSLTDFVVWCNSTTAVSYLTVEGCTFGVRKAIDAPGPELAAGTYSVIEHAGSPTYCQVRDTYITGGFKSIYLGGSGHRLTRLQLANQDKLAVDVVGTNVLLDAVLVTSCYTTVWIGGIFPVTNFKVGIGVRTGSGNCQITNCQVTFAALAATDQAIYAQSAVALCYNTLVGAAVAGSYSRVVGNAIQAFANFGSYSNVQDNDITAGAGAGTLDVAGHCTLIGNRVAGAFNASETASPVDLANNTFLGGGFLSATTTSSGDYFSVTTYVSTAGTYSGCEFRGGLYNNPAPSVASTNIFTGCRVSYTADTTILMTDSSFEGCSFAASIGVRITFDGLRNRFVGNLFTGQMTIELDDSTHSASQGYLFDANVIRTAGAEGGLRVHGNHCTITGNYIQGMTDAGVYGLEVYGPTGAGVVGYHNVIANNRIGLPSTAPGLNFNCQESTVLGNRVFGPIVAMAGSEGTVVSDNVIGESGVTVVATPMLSILGNLQVVEGNSCVGSLTVSGNAASVNNNGIAGNTVFTGINSRVTNNTLTLALSFGTGTGVLRGNTVGGAVTLAVGLGASGIQEISNNRFAGTTTIADADGLAASVLTGNSFIGAVNFSSAGLSSLTDCTFSGNFCIGAFTCQSALRTTFSGNRFADTTDLSGCVKIVAQGNWVGQAAGTHNLDMLRCDDYICVSNYVTGDILVPFGAGEVLCGLVVGNRCRSLGPGGALPTNYQVALGNKVANAGTVFTVAPLTTSVAIPNIKDDA